MTTYFAYINGLRGPEPQIWYGSPVDGAGKAKPCLKLIKLDKGDGRTLDMLAKAYPIEVEQ